MIRRALFVLALSTLLAGPLAAQVIDFETDPAGAPSVDDATLGLASAYTVGPLSITFGFDGDVNGVRETPANFEQAGTEQYRVRAFDSGNVLLATIDFIGGKTTGIGLAFNNFNATGEAPVPAVPATWGRVKGAYR